MNAPEMIHPGDYEAAPHANSSITLERREWWHLHRLFLALWEVRTAETPEKKRAAGKKVWAIFAEADAFYLGDDGRSTRYATGRR